jgi:aryl-alcohol dehydrogenase-like predicted oxidoreductase
LCFTDDRPIDLFYQHRVDPNVPIDDAVKELIRQARSSISAFPIAAPRQSAMRIWSSPSQRSRVASFNRFDSSGFRSAVPRFSPEAIKANMALVDLLREVGAAKGATPAQIALAWLLA